MFEIIGYLAIFIAASVIPGILVYLSIRGDAYWSGWKDGNRRLSYMNMAKTDWEARLYDKGYNEGRKIETKYTPGEVFTKKRNNS